MIFKIPKPGYPRDTTGTVTFSKDTSLGLEEMEINYATSITSKGARKVDYVSVRFPVRHKGIGTRVAFDDSSTTVDYNDDDELYSIRLTSIKSFVDVDTGEFSTTSDLEEHAASTQDIELVICFQLALQYWGYLQDNFSVLDIYGGLIKLTLEAQDGLPDEDEE